MGTVWHFYDIPDAWGCCCLGGTKIMGGAAGVGRLLHLPTNGAGHESPSLRSEDSRQMLMLIARQLQKKLVRQ